jgi:thiamine transporter ThiT
MAFVSKRRLIVVGVVLGLATVVGILFGYLAGVAVALAAVTIPLLVFGLRFGFEDEVKKGEEWGRKRFGPDEDRKR